MPNLTFSQLVEHGYRESRIWVLDNRTYIEIRNKDGDEKRFEIIGDKLIDVES